MKKITSKLVLEKDRTHALLNDVSNCWFPESIFIQIKKRNKLKSTGVITFLFKHKWWKWIGELLQNDDSMRVVQEKLLTHDVTCCCCCFIVVVDIIVVVVEGLSTSPPPATPTCWPRSPSSKVNSTPPHRKYWPGWKR